MRAAFAGSVMLLGSLPSGTTAQGLGVPADRVGMWELAVGTSGLTCRLQLRGQKSDKGDFFLSMPAACRHSIPALATSGRWSAPDATHLVIEDPRGAALLSLTSDGDGFAGYADGSAYRLTALVLGKTAAFSPEDPAGEMGRAPMPSELGAPRLAATTGIGEMPQAKLITVAHRHERVADDDKPSDLAGRYAVLRDKRDTGCMMTLDASHAKVGDRAQLAPGCRDQGIVIFDPEYWQVVKGQLVLTARAGHKTRLVKQDDGSWQKDPKEGGKPLGLKKL